MIQTLAPALAGVGAMWLVLSNYIQDYQLAFFDSIISISIFVLCTKIISNILRFYRPTQGRIWKLFVWIFLLGIAWIFGSFSLVSLVVPASNEKYQDMLLQSVMLRFFIALVVMVCSALIVWIRRQSESEARSQSRFNEIQQLYRETELNALRQQLQPHFLFNSLNSIQSLAATDAQKARNMVLQLSDFLRGTLRKDNHAQLTVEEEIEHTRLYLEIEMVRFSDRLQVEWKVDEKLNSVKIPALVLQPLVENAIKFGVYQTSGPVKLWVEVSEENKHVILSVKNPFDPELSGTKKGTGFGLNSLQRRLFLLYGRNDLVHTDIENNFFSASLKIPITS